MTRDLPDGAWMRSCTMPEAEATLILAALLKIAGEPTPTRLLQVAAIYALDPRLLLPHLSRPQAGEWCRLVGPEVRSEPPDADRGAAWGSAVRRLRIFGRLVENLDAGTWAPGPRIGEIDTTGWPDGRARFVWDTMPRELWR